MSVACATAKPVDVLAPEQPCDALPGSGRSSTGSDVSSEGTPTHELQSVERRYPHKDRLGDCENQYHDTGFGLRLATRLVELVGVKVEVSLAQALGERFGAKPREVDRAVRLLVGCLHLLQRCGYPREDIEVLVAQASAYLLRIVSGMRQEGQPEMGLTETVHVVCVLLYVAHAYCEDHNCPLHIWHKTLFQRYCALGTLNAAVIGLLGRLQFRLRVEEGELEAGLAFLRG